MRANSLPKAGASPEELAAFARLRYINDFDTGFSRQRNGTGFYYTDNAGRRVRDAHRVARFDALAIPPAWRDVWICRFVKGHLQATGRDARARKQYIYHPRWQDVSNLVKFSRMSSFGEALPKIRTAIARDMRGRKLTRARLLAGLLALLDATSARIGNEEYVAQNGSYGLASLRDRHVAITGRKAELKFVGKGGFRIGASVTEPALVRLLAQARAIPGPRLFQYEDEAGRRHVITAMDVNDYLRELTEQPFSAKDFRTWKASALAAGLLYAERDLGSATRRRRALKGIIDQTAAALGNTPSVCRNYYIHPGLQAAYLDGSFAAALRRFTPRKRKQFLPAEQVLAHFLAKQAAS
jgi:DNA topoisomerase I